MNNLRKKIFILLISILSLFIIVLFSIYNISIYNRESNRIKDRLIKININHEKNDDNSFGNRRPIFMDEEIYVVKYKTSGDIDEILSYSQEGLNEKQIKKLAIDNKEKVKKDKLNSLYINDYVFFINRDNNLVIMNNLKTKNYLLKSLISSLILFSFIEVTLIYLSYIITKWIVKPVEDAFTKQKQFISDASHELKTPLAIISASAETIEGKTKDKKWINNIIDETNRMNDLVTSLLELSKTEDMREKEVYSEVELSKLIENKALSFESLMFESNLSLDLDITPNIMLCCNQDRIRELLSILLDNAIKHGEKNSSIKVSLSKIKNTINLSVSNKGVEIPESEREKIFERFYRVDESRNRSESRYGLGLSIAKNIVENHNGSISVECIDGYTTFKVTLKQK